MAVAQPAEAHEAGAARQQADAARRAAELAIMTTLGHESVQVAEARVRNSLLLPGAGGYRRPTSAYFQRGSERQLDIAMPGSEKLLLSHESFIRPHLEKAVHLPSPFRNGTGNVRPELKAAVEYVASFDGDGAALARDRCRRLEAFREIADSLQAVEAELAAQRSPQADECLDGRARSAAIHAALLACDYPDTGFVRDQLLGFPCIGDYPDAGVFRCCERPATKTFDELDHIAHNAAVRARLRERWRSESEQTRSDMREISAQTYSHVKAGLEHGPFTEEQMNGMFGEGKWRALEAFAVHQGVNDDGTVKVRRCENARAASTNDCLASHDTITTEDPSLPIVITALFAEAYAPRRCPPMQHGTDDVEKAYKRMASAHPQATVFAIYDVRVRDVRFFTLPGHNFGLRAAVISWNRHSTLAAFLARCLFGVCTGGYFDDYDTCEPVWAGSSGKQMLRELHAMMGVPLSEEKDIAMAPANPFLGVISDLRRAAEGLVVVRSKPSRVAKLTVMIEEALACSRLGDRALELFGKLEYLTISACCHRIGRAALSTLREWHKANRRRRPSGVELSPEVELALEFFLFLLPRLPPRHILLRQRERAPLVVYTDAMYKTSTRLGRIGVVVYDPEASARGEPSYRHASAVVPPEVYDALLPRVQQVTVLEALGALTAITTFPEAFRGREVIHFIDNTGAMFNLANGYSGQTDMAMITHIFNAACAALGADVWFEWVPSAANIADLPSRGEFELLQELGSVEGEVVWPDLRSGWKAALEAAFDAYAPRPSRGSKRARAEVALAVSREKRARAAD